MMHFACRLMRVAAHTLANDNLTVRTGIHSGEVIGGVIGRRKFVFDVWGDTVNTASRMESNGVPGKIQVSSQTWELIGEETKAGYVYEEREIDAKGKGKLQAYLVDMPEDSNCDQMCQTLCRRPSMARQDWTTLTGQMGSLAKGVM